MDQHSLNGACAYINDFTEWYSNEKSPLNTMIFVEDRFSECSKEKKKALCKIFDKLTSKISADDNIYNIAEELFKELSS